MRHIAFASCIGTAIEFYDFYIYAFASALVIGELFFPSSNEITQTLSTFLTFGLAFISRPIGAIAFGHFGDKWGRKPVLAASLLFMGSSTLLIGLLPTYAQWGITATILLCVLRFCQGLGLGGEWGGAALLAIEHAPHHQRGWYGMFPQLGPSLGFVLAIWSFLAIERFLSHSAILEWGWRLPFFVSCLLVLVGIYVRQKLHETPDFVELEKVHHVPFIPLIKAHGRTVLLAGLLMSSAYVLFYTVTVFGLHYAVVQLHVPRPTFLWLLCLAVCFKVPTMIACAHISDRIGGKPLLMLGTLATAGVGFLMSPLMNGGMFTMAVFIILALCTMAIMLGPIGAFLTQQFPPDVRYSGAGLSYHLGGILGAAIAPALSEWLVINGGLNWVGYYISLVALISFWALMQLKTTSQTESLSPPIFT